MGTAATAAENVGKQEIGLVADTDINAATTETIGASCCHHRTQPKHNCDGKTDQKVVLSKQIWNSW